MPLLRHFFCFGFNEIILSKNREVSKKAFEPLSRLQFIGIHMQLLVQLINPNGPVIILHQMAD